MLTEGVWQDLLHNKNIWDSMLDQVKVKPTDSPSWKGLMRVKDDFFYRGYLNVGNGQDVKFWEDVLLRETSLAIQYPLLYNIVWRKNVLVSEALAQIPLNIGFKRTLFGNKWVMGLDICRRLMDVHLRDEPYKLYGHLLHLVLFW
jgi:hypothetical protein